uniref:ATP synthase CF0 B' subunit n=1 Tax=Gronococcus sybilensis TaxID=3028029 RepID=A0A9Y1I2K9_9RHOD|nr:ATP synthase CF0 B' subunit [Gronococcus sybilensis]
MTQQFFSAYDHYMIISAEGGLFDFNATLPLIALQFLILTFLLNLSFYRPVTKVLDERDKYIKDTLESASDSLKEAESLSSRYEEKLAEARKEAQTSIKSSQQEAQSIVEKEITQAQEEANQLIQNSTEQLDTQKEKALIQLESEVHSLTRKVYNKLLGAQSVL